MDEAQERIDGPEFAEWLAYWSLSPPVGIRLDVLFADLAWNILTKFMAKDVKYGDLLPDWTEGRKRLPTQERLAAKMDAFAAALAKIGG